LREWPTQKNKHVIRSSLDLCTHYRRFIYGFTIIAKPLKELTENKQSFQRTPDVEAAFQPLKGALSAGPILANSQPQERFIADNDESNVGIGRILSQVQDPQKRVTAYYSKTLNKAEENY
jgi:hypothetical protein